MQEFIVLVIQGAVVGAVVEGIANYVTGDDVLKCVKGGIAAGIATVLTGQLMTSWNLLLKPY